MRASKVIVIALTSMAIAFCQSASLSTQVAAQQAAIQAAVDKGDLIKALDLTTSLRATLKAAMISNAPTPTEILAQSEELIASSSTKDPNGAAGRLYFHTSTKRYWFICHCLFRLNKER